LEDEDIIKAYSLCLTYFRVSHENKNSDLYRWILSKLEIIDTEYSEKKMEVGVYFDILDGKG
jgi:hypothetical protein